MATNNKAALSRRRRRGKLVEHGCFPSAVLASIPTLSAGIEAEPQFVENVLIPFLCRSSVVSRFLIDASEDLLSDVTLCLMYY